MPAEAARRPDPQTSSRRSRAMPAHEEGHLRGGRRSAPAGMKAGNVTKPGRRRRGAFGRARPADRHRRGLSELRPTPISASCRPNSPRSRTRCRWRAALQRHGARPEHLHPVLPGSCSVAANSLGFKEEPYLREIEDRAAASIAPRVSILIAPALCRARPRGAAAAGAARAGSRAGAHPLLRQRCGRSSATATSTSPRPSASRSRATRSGTASCAISRPATLTGAAMPSSSASPSRASSRRRERSPVRDRGRSPVAGHPASAPPSVTVPPGCTTMSSATARRGRSAISPISTSSTWNATGTGWTFPIDSAEARDHAARGRLPFMRSAIYTGPQGAAGTETDAIVVCEPRRARSPSAPRRRCPIMRG